MNQDIINIDQVNDLPTLKKRWSSLELETKEDATKFLAILSTITNNSKNLKALAYEILNEAYKVQLRKIQDGDVVVGQDVDDPADLLIGDFKVKRIERTAKPTEEIVTKSADYLYYEQQEAVLKQKLEENSHLLAAARAQPDTTVKITSYEPKFSNFKIS